MRIPKFATVPLLVLPWLFAVGLFAWIFINRFPPSGVYTASSVMDGNSPFINPFLPSERVSVPGEQPEGWIGQRITGDPTYFTARIPGPYETAEVEIEFKPLRQPLLEFGIVRDESGGALELGPMYSAELQSDSWVKFSRGYVKKGMAPATLTKNDPEGLAIWSAPATMPELKDEARPMSETKTSLRGAHDFYFVPAGGSLDVALALQDVNRKRGNTSASFRLFRGDEELKREVIGTSGSGDKKMGQVFEHRIFLKDALPGVYRISMQSDDEVFIRSVKTTSKRWVIGPRLNFGDTVGFATSTLAGQAWTTSRHVLMETFHREGLQTISLGAKEVKVIRTHETFRIDRVDSDWRSQELKAPKGDIRFLGDGWFALKPEAYFEPKPKRLTDGTDLKLENIEGVITAYKKPEDLKDGWLRARTSFKLDPSADRLRFVLSAPGISSRMGAVDVRRITIKYQRPPMNLPEWFRLVKQEAVNAWRRL